MAMACRTQATTALLITIPVKTTRILMAKATFVIQMSYASQLKPAARGMTLTATAGTMTKTTVRLISTLIRKILIVTE